MSQVLRNLKIVKILPGGDNDLLRLQRDFELFVYLTIDTQEMYDQLFNGEKQSYQPTSFSDAVNHLLNISLTKAARAAERTVRNQMGRIQTNCFATESWIVLS